MTSYHHLYPFSPWGLHGGTLRLRTAVEASQLEGTAVLSWWDGTQRAWRSDAPVQSIGSADPDAKADFHTSGYTRLKRWVFPFSLWETGRKRCVNVAHILREHPESTVVLHTSPLAPLAAELRRSGRRVVVDVHDAVFRGHLDDSRSASGLMRATRRTYAATVRHRERRALAAADWLAIAGWDDMQRLAAMGLERATWAPTGLTARLSPNPGSGQLCVGLLGNFQHGPTAQAALDLLASSLGQDPGVQIILAGIGSERHQTTAKVRSLGRIETTDEFYEKVHATVVLVTNGTGMKCKLAEAALAGKAVITTRLGAAGYPAKLHRAFVVIDDAGSLDKRVVVEAIERTSPETIRAAFDSVVGRTAAARTYADMLSRVSHTSMRSR